MLWSAKLTAIRSSLPPFNHSIFVFGQPKVYCSHSHAMETNNDTPKAKPLSFDFLSKKPYSPPSWASHLKPIPSHVFSLGHVSNLD